MNNQDHGLSQAEQRIAQGASRPPCAAGTSGLPAASPARVMGRRGWWQARRPPDQLSPRSQFDGPVAPVDRSKATMRRPTPPSGPWVTLLRVAWLAILLAAAGPAAGGSRMALPSAPALLAETSRPCPGRCWSVSASPSAAWPPKARCRWSGLTGAAGRPAGLDGRQRRAKGRRRGRGRCWRPRRAGALWLLAIKAAEYGALGLALEWVGRRAWHSALGHLAVG